MGLNLLETKGTNIKLPMSDKNLAPRTQIRTEFIKEATFRIYVAHKDYHIFNGLCNNIREHKSVYTISLGLSELLADLSYISIYNSEESTDGRLIELSTPVTMSNLKSDGLEIETGKKYFKEKIPIIMSPARVVKMYDDVIFEPNGNTIKARVATYHKLENGENIAFL